MPEKEYYAHPTAVIDEPCTIGKGTKIWHFSHVMKGAVIGEACSLGQNVYVGSRAKIGRNCKIQNNVSLYDCVEIEDDVFCGPSMVFTNVFNPRSHVSRKDEYRSTKVKRGTTIGANATIVCGTTLGRYCFVGAGAVVTKNIPDYAMVVGVPARIAGWMSKHGEKLRFDGNGIARCPATGEIYRQVGPDSIVAASDQEAGK